MNKRCKQWVEKQSEQNNEPAEDIIPFVETFLRRDIKQRIRDLGFSTDLWAYNLKKLVDILNMATITDTQNITKDDIELLSVIDGWELWYPKTIRGSVFFGLDGQSQWCTVGGSGNVLETYTSDNDSFLFYLKNDAIETPYHRVAICIDAESNQIVYGHSTVNSLNAPISPNTFKEVFGVQTFAKVFTRLAECVEKEEMHPIARYFGRIASNIFLFKYHYDKKVKLFKKSKPHTERVLRSFVMSVIRRETDDQVFDFIMKNFPTRIKNSVLSSGRLSERVFTEIYTNKNMHDELRSIAKNRFLPHELRNAMVKHKSPKIRKLICQNTGLLNNHKITLLKDLSASVRAEAAKRVRGLDRKSIYRLINDSSIKVARSASSAIIRSNSITDRQRANAIGYLLQKYPNDKIILSRIIKRGWRYHKYLELTKYISEETILKYLKSSSEYKGRVNDRPIRNIIFFRKLSPNIIDFIKSVMFDSNDGANIFWDLMEAEHLSMTEARKIATEQSEEYKMSFLYNYPEKVPEEWFLDLACSLKNHIRRDLASSMLLPYQIQRILVNDKCWEVRRALTRCHNLFDDIKEVLKKDSSKGVRIHFSRMIQMKRAQERA